MVRFYPEFKARDKKFIIKEYIATILKSFTLDEKFTSNALTLFDHFYPLIQYTKEEVIAAVICVLTTILFDLYEVSMKTICDKAGIRQSSISKCFSKIIFPYLEIPDNSALKTNFEVIKDKIRQKLPILGIKKIAIEDNVNKPPKIAQKKNIPYPPELVSKIKELRRDRMSIKDIAQKTDVREFKARGILQKHFLGYQNYRPLNKKQNLTPITPELISQIINLRRQFTSIQDISKKVELSETETEEILKKKFLGYQQYDPINFLITPELKSAIMHLKKQKYSNDDIAEDLNISVFVVNRILEESKVSAVVEMWNTGISITKITEKMKIPRRQVTDILKHKLGDFHNYLIRYQISQQEIDEICQFRQEGFSIPEIARMYNRNRKLTNKIIRNNLKDYPKYRYIPPKDRERNKKIISKKQVKTELQNQNNSVTPQLANYYMNYQPVVHLFDSLLEVIRLKKDNKAPLDKLSSLMLNNKEKVKKNISKICDYLSKMNKFRAEKTILGLVLALSFPQVTQTDVSNLVGVSSLTLRNNLAIKNIKKNFGHVIDVQINFQFFIFVKYLENII